MPLRPAPPVEADEPQPIVLQGDESKPGIILSDELKDKVSRGHRFLAEC